MTRTIVFITLSIFLFSCFNKIRSKNAFSPQNDCEKSWNYFSLTDTLTGRVLFHEKPPFTCGILTTASLTVIKTEKNDTIRVLWVCNMNVVFKESTTVKIYPEKKPGYSVSLPNKKNKYDCSIKNTCYGSILSTDHLK